MLDALYYTIIETAGIPEDQREELRQTLSDCDTEMLDKLEDIYILAQY